METEQLYGPVKLQGLSRNVPLVSNVEFVVGSRPCSKGCSPGLPVSLPPQYPIFLFDLETEDKKNHLTECPLPIDNIVSGLAWSVFLSNIFYHSGQNVGDSRGAHSWVSSSALDQRETPYPPAIMC